jgi:N-acetylmuramoyl-L-alanine amidase
MVKVISKMKRVLIFVFFILAGVCLLFVPTTGSAQTALERISANERSDGKGYVVRYHLNQMIDSSAVVQPTTDLIQMKLYSDYLDTLNLRLPPQTSTFTKIEVHKTSTGIGINLHLGDGIYFKSSTYPDQNGRDLLLALEWASYDEIQQITHGVEPLVWNLENPDLNASLNEIDDDDSFLRLKDDDGFNVIVLDAGHGGHDPGASGVGGINEKDVALAVTLKVGEYLKEYLPDVKVVYTREEDKFVPLSERGLIATRSKADLFVSIHANSVRNAPSANGTETFFLGLARSQSALEVMKRENSVVDLENGSASLDLSEEELLIYELTNAGNMAISERIATNIEDQFKTRVNRRSRGVKQAGLEALWHASTPAVLVELGFLSNQQEARFLTSEYGQTLMASAIFRAIRDFKLEYERSLRQNNRNRASNDR